MSRLMSILLVVLTMALVILMMSCVKQEVRLNAYECANGELVLFSTNCTDLEE